MIYQIYFRPRGAAHLVRGPRFNKRGDAAMWILKHGLGKWCKIVSLNAFC
jgi:hypothetical protein